jgi:hypothetical protein
MLEGSQLRLLNTISLLSVFYHNQKRNGENFHMCVTVTELTTTSAIIAYHH